MLPDSPGETEFAIHGGPGNRSEVLHAFPKFAFRSFGVRRLILRPMTASSVISSEASCRQGRPRVVPKRRRGSQLGVHAAGWYSLIRPLSRVRRLTRWKGLAGLGWSGRGGRGVTAAVRASPVVVPGVHGEHAPKARRC